MRQILCKTPAEIRILARNAADLAAAAALIQAQTAVGDSLKVIDQRAEKLIRDWGGEPAFQKVPGYRWATCVNVNEGVVHGVPDDYMLKDGDLVTVDTGLWREGLYSDMSRGWVVGKQSAEKKAFVQAGRDVLVEAIAQAKAGNHVGHLSQAIEHGLGHRGLWPVQTLTGHGIGRELHEPPVIPCFVDRPIEKTPKLEPGMVLAIEVIYTQRPTSLKKAADGWTIRTEDGSLGGVEEDMVLVTEREPRVLTKCL